MVTDKQIPQIACRVPPSNAITTEIEGKTTVVGRALSYWPYVFIAISIIGFAYMLWNALR